MNQKSIKSGTKRLQITLTNAQIDEAERHIGLLGSNTSDVVRFIVADWLNQNRRKGKDE